MYSISKLSINRPITMLMVFCAICICGMLALFRITVELMPNTSFGNITIFIGVRGSLPPPQIENLITRKVEDAVSSVSHLQNVISTSKMNKSVVTLEFEPDTNMDFAALEVREHFNKIKDELPQDNIEKPIIAKYEENDLPIYILAFTSSEYSSEFLREVVENQLKEQILRVNGVANVEIGGGRERKVIVELDQSRLQSYRISIKKVIHAISMANVDLLEGDITTERMVVAVKTMGTFKSVEDLQELPILSGKDSGMVRLKHIAEVKDSYLEAQSYSRFSNQGAQAKDAVSLYVQKESKANTILVTNRLEEVIGEFTKTLHAQYAGIDIHTLQVQAKHIKEAVRTVINALLFGAILATVILYLFLKKIKLTFVVIVVIPISIMVTFTLMYLSGISLNIISLSGLALGIGMLLDNSIVVLENIMHRIRTGSRAENIKTTIMSGSQEMTLAIAASTLTTIIVFLPITFINKQIRMLYSDLSLTVTYSLLASLFVALTAVPLFTYYLCNKDRSLFIQPATLKKTKKSSYPALYRRMLARFLRYRNIGILTVIGIFVCSLLIYRFGIEKEFIGTTEQNEFTIFIELDAGIKLNVTNDVVSAVEQRLSELPEVSKTLKTSQSRVEGWSSKIYVSLVPKADRVQSTEEFIAYLRENLKTIQQKYTEAGAFIYFSEPQSSKEFIIDVYGFDYEKTAEIANEIAGKMGTGFTDIKLRYRPGRPTYDFIIDKAKAAMHDLSIQEIADSFHAQLRGMRASFFHTEAKELEIIPRLAAKYRSTVKSLDNLTVVNQKGDLVSAGSFLIPPQYANRYNLIPSEIWRKNKSRMIQVSATLDNISLTKAARAVNKVISELTLPKHYYCEIGGEYERMIQNEKEFKFAIIISLLLVYAVLAALFESYIHPLIIMFTVPLGFIGVIFAIFFTVRIITIGVFIGILMLGGIVVNNAIILIDRMNAILREHNSQSTFVVLRAVFKSSISRLRPIMMTTLTTILGLIPMALDRSESSNLWSPLAIAVIGGLLTSTFLTLIIIPSLYLTADTWGEKIKYFFLRTRNE
ncbi:MAG: efflux RND transporter permease subunit [bacterium]